MSGPTLVIAEAARSTGEFRRPQVRRVYAAYARRYRARLGALLRRLSAEGPVTVLAARDLADPATLPAGIEVRYYDEAAFQGDAPRLAALTHALVAAWWPEPEREPALRVRGVWLPDLLPVGKGILVRLEVVEYVGAVAAALDATAPARVVLASGRSIPERVARALATERGIAVRCGTRAVAPALLAHAWRALRRRDDRQALTALLRQPRRPLDGTRRRILLSVCHARHLEMVRPLAHGLVGDGVDAAVISGTVNGPELQARLDRLGAEGVPWSWLIDHLPVANAAALVRGLRPEVARLRRRLTAMPAPAALDGHGGAGLAQIVAPFADSAIRWSLPVARLYLEAADRALDRAQPEAVVIASDRRLAERALALAAQARNIPTLLFWGSSLLARDRINRFDVGHRILVIGDHVRTALVEQGIDPRRLAVVGDPRSDAARRVPRGELRAQVRRDLGLPGEAAHPLVVLVSKYVSMLFSGGEKHALYRTVIEARRGLPEADIVVKVHPNEDVRLLREQVGAWGWPDACLTQEYDIHRLFAAADGAVMVTSMAGIEAMAMGCPVIAVQTPDKDFEGGLMPPYVTERAVERVDLGDGAGLARALRAILEDRPAREDLVERGRKFAARYVHPVDGRLAERLLGVAAEVRAELAGGGR